MEITSSRGRYLPHAVVATLFVAVLPLLAATRVSSLLWSLLAGTALSLGASVAGTWLWSRRSGASDLVFGDLMLWGWLRRLFIERRLASAVDSLGLNSPIGDVTISKERRTEILQELAATLESKDPYTHGHSRRVTRHSYMIAKTMGLSEADVEMVRVAASVHDVGKLNLPVEVLHKTGKLTDEEFSIIKGHAAKGAEIVERLGILELTALVRHHHERLDGKGYPDRLAGDDIPLGSRIIAVADTFDAITSTRSYRSASGHRKAIEVLRKEAGTQLDPDAVRAFLTYYSGRGSMEWWASLTTVPQRLLGSLASWLQGAGAASVLSGTAAVGAAVLLSTPVSTALDNHQVRDQKPIRSVSAQNETHDEADAGAVENPNASVRQVDKTISKAETAVKVGDAESGSPRGVDGLQGVSGNGPTAAGDSEDVPSSTGGSIPGVTAPDTSSADVGTAPVATDPDSSADTVTEPVTNAVDSVTEPATSAVDKVTDPVTSAVEPVTEPATSAVDKVTDPVTSAVDKVKPPLGP